MFDAIIVCSAPISNCLSGHPFAPCAVVGQLQNSGAAPPHLLLCHSHPYPCWFTALVEREAQQLFLIHCKDRVDPLLDPLGKCTVFPSPLDHVNMIDLDHPQLTLAVILGTQACIQARPQLGLEIRILYCIPMYPTCIVNVSCVSCI